LVGEAFIQEAAYFDHAVEVTRTSTKGWEDDAQVEGDSRDEAQDDGNEAKSEGLDAGKGASEGDF